MFQAVMSASVIGLPRPGVSATAVPAPKASTKARAKTGLCIDMFDLPVAPDAPAGNAVVVLVGERHRACHRLVCLTRLAQEPGAAWLPLAGPDPRPGLQA